MIKTKFILPVFFKMIVLVIFFRFGTVFGRPPEFLQSTGLGTQWLELDHHILYLNGLGIHSVTIFNIPVYEISLFVEKKSHQAEAILASPERKIIHLRFLRDLEADQLKKGLSDGFYENCLAMCHPLEGDFERLASRISSFKAEDFLDFKFIADRVILSSSRGDYFEVSSPGFGRVLLSIWLGRSPPSSGLKEKLLGF